MFSPLIDTLIKSLRVLPGIGPKSAQRMALHLLERDRNAALALADAIRAAAENVQHCAQCRAFTEDTLCAICADPKRDASTLCIVESPADFTAIEQAGMYRGHYFLLMGHLSPIDGIGPEQIGIDLLAERFRSDTIKEVILATGTTVEGEATAYYIQELATSFDIPVSRIAHGVPMGGELEYIDANTISLAFSGRTTLR